MATQVAHESASNGSLVLSNVSLHIDSLVPRSSLTSSEDLKATAAIATGTDGCTDPSDMLMRHGSQQRPLLSAQDSWAQLQLKDRMRWMETFKLNKRGGLVFQDREALKKQQGVFKEVMLQVGSQLLSGKLGVRISLPIRIFEPRTLLERVADGWSYAPTLLKKAALSGADPLGRLKLVMAFVAGGLHFCVGQLKPFNPILGETYEATYPDGTQIFMEHVGHHPVKSAFSVMGPKGLYQLSGMFEFEAVTSRNSIVNRQVGIVAITFQDGAVVTYTMPEIKMNGLLFGDRVVEIVGSSRFEDAANHLVGELNFDANNGFLKKSQGDDIRGHIYPAKKSVKHALSTINGSYWHVESEPAFGHTPVANPLPSDLRYREDVIALKVGDIVLASELLNVMQVGQSYIMD
ncbi:hypothetical protein BBJ28_00009123 [Nothophytophthora sp. Chile5]|nr:hypothetical protein BBJ28_00009123 [Nothophytophthora sp. Chile5]